MLLIVATDKIYYVACWKFMPVAKILKCGQMQL